MERMRDEVGAGATGRAVINQHMTAPSRPRAVRQPRLGEFEFFWQAVTILCRPVGKPAWAVVPATLWAS